MKPLRFLAERDQLIESALKLGARSLQAPDKARRLLNVLIENASPCATATAILSPSQLLAGLRSAGDNGSPCAIYLGTTNDASRNPIADSALLSSASDDKRFRTGLPLHLSTAGASSASADKSLARASARAGAGNRWHPYS